MSEPNESYIGGFTQAAGVTLQQIENGTASSVPSHLFTNGFVLEVCGYAAKKFWPDSRAFQVLYDTAPDEKLSSVKAENLRPVIAGYKKKGYKKGSKKYKNFMYQTFYLCRGVSARVPSQNSQNQAEVYVSVSKSPKPSSTHVPVNAQVKERNSLDYEISKKQKALVQLKEKTVTEKAKLNVAVGNTGHYGSRNVAKRDATAKISRTELKKVKKSHQALEKEVCELKQVIEHEQTKSKGESDQLKSKVLAEQKTKSKAKVNLQKEKKAKPAEIESLKCKIQQQAEYIKYLENELEKFKGKCETHHEKVLHLRDTHGYTLDARMCINNLSSIQLAQEKVPEALETIARDIFHVTIPKDHLPSRKTVQNINDEGHYIAKRFIAEQLRDAEYWGVLKDGTQRQKQKLCDTSVKLDSGDIICLGFKRVAKEDALTIAAVTKEHLTELADIDSGVGADYYIEKVLETLSFYMSDRAANEKKSNVLLDDWRKDILTACGSDKAKQKVHHMFCMAHVLLGFHKDVTDGLFKLQKEYVNDHGPLGRDRLEKFATWTPEGIATRVARISSDVFGPIGDHLGVRDVWQAECARQGVKSKIGTYKDNRFNCVFETAVQVIHHRADFKTLLDSWLLKNPSANKKLHSLREDLGCEVVMTFIHATALTFLHVTGPFWRAMQHSDLPYVNLSTFVQPLAFFLKDCVENPALLLEDPPEFLSVHSDPAWGVYTKVKDVKDHCTPLLKQCLSTIAAALVRVIERQLVAFLPGGTYDKPASGHELKRTSCAPKTNLGPEHHFGDLDSSQKRRPNCTLHHHSTIQLLKRNGRAIRKWYGEMSEDKQELLWADARRNGSLLRTQHKLQELAELKKISESLQAPPPKKRKTTAVTTALATTPQAEQAALDKELLERMPSPATVYCEEQWVAVAYQDHWHPGIIREVKVPDGANADHVVVKVDFMKRSQCKGSSDRFKAPSNKDVQIVETEFIIATDFTPTSMSNGRWFTIANAINIETTFELFKKLNFD